MSIPVMSSKSEVLMAETKLTVFWALLPEEKPQVPLYLVCVYIHHITQHHTPEDSNVYSNDVSGCIKSINFTR